MQINTAAAIITAITSAGIGFGLAFYIERKISSQMKKKSQKILIYIGMTSFGVGLAGILNELIGFPLQGLNIRYQKVGLYLIGNVIFIPATLIFIAQLLGNGKPSKFSKTKSQSGQFDISQNDVPDSFWGLASAEFKNNRNENVWARCFAYAKGDLSKAEADYIQIRAKNLYKESISIEPKVTQSSPPKKPRSVISDELKMFNDSFNTTGKIGIILIVFLLLYGAYESLKPHF